MASSKSKSLLSLQVSPMAACCCLPSERCLFRVFISQHSKDTIKQYNTIKHDTWKKKTKRPKPPCRQECDGMCVFHPISPRKQTDRERTHLAGGCDLQLDATAGHGQSLVRQSLRSKTTATWCPMATGSDGPLRNGKNGNDGINLDHSYHLEWTWIDSNVREHGF